MNTIFQQTAWAVASPGIGVLIRTVAATRRGAIFNWLTFHVGLRNQTDNQIEVSWARLQTSWNVSVVQIKITAEAQTEELQCRYDPRRKACTSSDDCSCYDQQGRRSVP